MDIRGWLVDANSDFAINDVVVSVFSDTTERDFEGTLDVPPSPVVPPDTYDFESIEEDGRVFPIKVVLSVADIAGRR